MKLKQFQNHLKSSGIDYALFVNVSARQQDWGLEYLTSIDDLEYGAYLVTPRTSYLVCVGFEVERFKQGKIPVKDAGRDMFGFLAKQIKKGSVVGMNFSSIDRRLFMDVKKKLTCKFVDVSKKLIELRETKTSVELKYMRKAAAIGDSIIAECFSVFSQFTSEQDVSLFLRHLCAAQGVEFSFPAIVASGKHAAICHHVPTTKLYKGFCVIDFGVKYKGYCSDMTRTVYLGNPNSTERDVYDLLLAVQKKGVKMLKPGVSFNEVNTALRSELGKYADYFIHSFGHSLGMDVHDPVSVSRKDLKFRKDMVFTMEPGIYVRGKFGMRIEDDVVVGKTPRVLTKMSKDLFTIPI